MGRHNNREQVYIIRFGTHNTHSVVTSATVVATNHKQAERMSHNFPNAKSVAKAQTDYDGIEKGEFRNFTARILAENKAPMSALAMDEFIWLRRKNRIEHKEKDKWDT